MFYINVFDDYSGKLSDGTGIGTPLKIAEARGWRLSDSEDVWLNADFPGVGLQIDDGDLWPMAGVGVVSCISL